MAVDWGAEHFEYQAPPDADHLWVETIMFPIVVPEAHLFAFVYTNVRPGLGVMWNQVIVCGVPTDTRAELLHYAENPHLPAPDSFSDIQSPLGLRIQSVDAPWKFRIDYVADDGTEIHVDWTNLMPPFDIHNPEHSPQAGRALDIHADIDPGDSPPNVGHADMTGRATGTVKVRGREFVVDSIERMDRSWGPRDPMKAGKQVHVISATFGEDLAFHMICPWEPDRKGRAANTLSHGYVLRDGEVHGLTDELTMTSQSTGFLCTSLDMQVTDAGGRQYHLRAYADVGAPWIAAPSALVHLSMMRWTLDGREGYGIVMRTHLMAELNRRFGRFYDDPPGLVHV
ncbi:DUF7064 domain-containing protein [Nocardioides sp. YJ-D4]